MRAGSLTASQCHCRRDNGIIAHRNLLLKLYSLQLGEPKLLCTTRHCFASNRDERLTIESDLIQKYLHSLLEEYTDRRSSANRNMAELEAVVSRFILYQQKKEEISELNRMITECGSDKEVMEMANDDITKLKQLISHLEAEILNLMTPVEMADGSDVILEVSAGVGGQEAMLFTKEIFDMYCNYAAFKNWTVQIINYEVSDVGGLRHATVSFSGRDVYRYLKFEGGVHRVQRVPKTERSGRIHTSTMTVAVMAQPSEIDIEINPKDLRIDTFRAAGKGGQHVNTTDSAVRIVHLPTGTVAECQTERSQIRNRETAMKLLRSRLYEKETEKRVHQQSMTRKLQVGSANRNEKIRTYNFKDDRVSDHRIGQNVFDVEELLSGGLKLDELILMLQSESRQEMLTEKLRDSLAER